MVSRKGVPRVVWERRRNGTTNGEQVDFIPFLSVSRSLGDFWSYCPRSEEFVVSPRPDVYVHALNAKVQKFIVIASDGLWNVMSPKQVVEFIWDYEHAHEDTLHQPRDVVRAVINEALSRWNSKHLLADNIAVLIAFLSEDDYCSPSVADVTPSVEEEVASTATTASPTPSSNVGSSPELRANDTPPLRSDSPVSSASPSNAPSPSPTSSPSTSSPSPSSPAGPSSSTSPSESTSAPSPSTSPQQSQVEQQQQEAEVVNTVHKTRGGSTSHYKETFADGVTVECHTKIRLRHRKRHHNSHSKVKATSSSSGGAGSSTNGADTTEGLRRSPLKRERPEESNADECSSKRLKVDLPDSGCDCNSDKMDTEDSSPPVKDEGERTDDCLCVGSSSDDAEHSGGVFSDHSTQKSKNRPAKKFKR